MVCNCNPETVCKKVCKRAFNGWINSPIFSLKVKESKKATLTFTDVRKFSLYQVYNDFNKEQVNALLKQFGLEEPKLIKSKSFREKYLKYKNKYLNLKKLLQKMNNNM